MLEPLSDAAARALLDALPERALVEDDAVGTMLDSADGNPLFLEQIAAFAAERPLAPGEVPPTLETLLASRLDLLSEAERDVIERAAVVGREFSREAVDALSPPDEVAAVGPSLMALMRRRLVRPDRAAPVGEDGFRFEHVLIREAAYASIPRIRRAGLHERLARWLGASSARKEVIGFHLEQACLDGNGDDGIQARGSHGARRGRRGGDLEPRHRCGGRLASPGRLSRPRRRFAAATARDRAGLRVEERGRTSPRASLF